MGDPFRLEIAYCELRRFTVLLSQPKFARLLTSPLVKANPYGNEASGATVRYHESSPVLVGQRAR
jgi:hypothetical protein